MPSNVVGSRELKVRLGAYLRRVRQGETLIVTDRGEPVAELRPLPSQNTRDAILAKLEASGAVARPSQRSMSPFRPIKSGGESAAAAIVAERADRF